jgi:hypothetical protein
MLAVVQESSSTFSSCNTQKGNGARFQWRKGKELVASNAVSCVDSSPFGRQVPSRKNFEGNSSSAKGDCVYDFFFTPEKEEEGRSKFHGNPGSFGASIGSIAYLQQITRLRSKGKKGKKRKKGKRAITVHTQ